LHDLSLDQKKIALHLAGILRLANALDSPGNGSVPRIAVDADQKGVIIMAERYNPWTTAAEKVASAAYLLELVLHRPILVKRAPQTAKRSARRAVPAKRR
jgi:hypothetical protein